MKEKIKNIPYWVYDLLSVLSAIITIVTAIVAIFKAIVSIKELEDGTYVVSFNNLLLWFSIIILLCFSVCLVKVLKYGKIVKNIRQVFSENYYLFLHDFRNTYFDILKQHKNKSGQSEQNRMILLTKDTQTLLINALDYLCEILTKNTGYKVCACVKLIENTGNVTNIDKETATVTTFCRSKNTDKNRKANDEKDDKSISIKKNTDFYDILNKDSPTNSYFYQTDLLQYAKNLKKVGRTYLNTTENFDKYYRGTIVAPIRIKRDKLHYITENNGYDILGFLCVDSLSVNAFRDDEFDRDNYSNIVKSFAAEMYIILNKYNFYLNKINGGK